MLFTKKESRCGNCINYSVKLYKEKKHTEDMSQKSFSYAALRNDRVSRRLITREALRVANANAYCGALWFRFSNHHSFHHQIPRTGLENWISWVKLSLSLWTRLETCIADWWYWIYAGEIAGNTALGLYIRCPDIFPPGHSSPRSRFPLGHSSPDHNSPFPLFQSVITPVIVALVVIIERRCRLQLPDKRTII